MPPNFKTLKLINPPPLTPLKETKVFVAAKFEEKPEKDSWYTVVTDGGINTLWWWDSMSGWDEPILEHNYTHWLKEKTAYLFTREELEGLLGDAFRAGGNHIMEGGIQGEFEDLPKNVFPDKSSYIKQLLDEKSV